ncbi:hypothetical protein NEPAR04_0342 [Nematocida parisii]|nr:hypothetical protein NEPAR03_0068 [Nematocida parisii]KAI5125517.1 hypothetical protein NEPAR08_0068 [Nematocida parisii]KAI5140601.1 hypothetical protein NEPAR04_0342 [Nematocida parisii]
MVISDNKLDNKNTENASMINTESSQCIVTPHNILNFTELNNSSAEDTFFIFWFICVYRFICFVYIFIIFTISISIGFIISGILQKIKKYSEIEYLKDLILGGVLGISQLIKYTIDRNNFYIYIMRIPRKNIYSSLLYSVIIISSIGIVLGIIISILFNSTETTEIVLKSTKHMVELGIFTSIMQIIEVVGISLCILIYHRTVIYSDKFKRRIMGIALSLTMFIILLYGWFVYYSVINKDISYLLSF